MTIPPGGLDRRLQEPDAAAVVADDDVREIHERQAEAKVRFIRAVLAHGLAVGEAGEGAGEVDAADVLPEGDHQPLDDVLHVLFDDEAHLDVDLRELGLAVEPEIFVAEAAHDLEVAVHARHHEQLLEDLGRLRERVELTGVEPRRDQEVAGAARRVLHHERRFDLGEPVGGQVAARRLIDRGPNQEVLLQRGAAQVEVAVLEPHGLARGRVIGDLEGRRLRAREDGEGVGLHFDLAGGEIRVLVAAALDDDAGDADAELSA